MNPYEILGVDKSADLSTVKLAYKLLAQQLHPDKEGGDADKFQQVKDAYDILKDPERRKRYDETGATEMETPVQQAAVADLMVCFDMWLKSVIEGRRPANEDCVEFMQKQFNIGISRALQEKTQMDEAVARLMIVNEKFSGGESDMLNGHVASRMNAIISEVEGLNNKIKIMEEAKELLNHVEYSHDKGLQMHHRGGVGSFTNSTATGTSWP